MTGPLGGLGARRDALLLVGAFALVYVVWGSTYLAIAWAVETIPPFTMIGARCLIAGTLMYAWARTRGGPRPGGADWAQAMVAGTLLFGTGQATLAWAETRVASGPAALLIATEPLFIVLLGWWGGTLTGSAARGPRPTRSTLAALAVGFAGVGVMVLPTGLGRLDGWGVGAALLASLSWSVGVLRTRARPGLPAVQVAGMQLLAGAMSLAVIALAMGEGPQLASARPSTRSLLAFGYLVLFGSVVTYSAYVWLLDRVGAERLSTHAYVNPVVAVALGALLAGEAVTGSLVAAMVLILGAVAVLVRPTRAATGHSRHDDPRPRRGDAPRTPRRSRRDALPSDSGPRTRAA